jgi:hypothetical protein
MKFSFCLITTGTEHCKNLVDSIVKCVPEDCRDIVVVGGNDVYNGNVNHIPFDESVRGGWITRKKNIAVQNSKYDNLVFLHDYLLLDSNWYNWFLGFGDNFSICSNVIKNLDGSRFRDWHIMENIPGPAVHFGMRRLLPYDFNHRNLSLFMYMNGSYWVAKKEVMKSFPLDESRGWGQGEDYEWASRVACQGKQKFTFNKNSLCGMQKQNPVIFGEMSNHEANMLHGYLEGIK